MLQNTRTATVFCLLLCCLSTLVSGQQEKQQIISLPDIDKLPTPMYSGYIKISEGKNIFYILAQSANEADPLVLWLNGGPGCSAMFGLFGEVGPFSVYTSGKLTTHDYSLTKSASVVYVDAPGATGFSDHPDEKLDDDKTADMLLTVLNKIYELFPNYQKKPLYLAGESYAAAIATRLGLKIVNKKLGGRPV